MGKNSFSQTEFPRRQCGLMGDEGLSGPRKLPTVAWPKERAPCIIPTISVIFAAAMVTVPLPSLLAADRPLALPF